MINNGYEYDLRQLFQSPVSVPVADGDTGSAMESENRVAYSSRMHADKSYTSFTWRLEDYTTLKTFYWSGLVSPHFKISQTNCSCFLNFQVRENCAIVTVNFPVAVELHTLKLDVSIIDESRKKILTKSSVASAPLRLEPLEPRGALEKRKPFAHKLLPAADLTTQARYLTNDTLALLCEITIIKSVKSSPIVSVTQERSLIGDCRKKFEEFRADDSFADVTLSVQGARFRAHKLILAASSPVFEAKFRASMAKGANTEVKIRAIKPAAFGAFLKSLYTGDVAPVEEHVDSILILADEYRVAALRNLCEERIIDRLDDANAIDYLLLAHAHGLDDLKRRALAIVINSHDDLSRCPNFKTLCDCPELVSEVFQKISERDRQPEAENEDPFGRALELECYIETTSQDAKTTTVGSSIMYNQL